MHVIFIHTFKQAIAMLKEVWIVDKQTGTILLQRSYRDVMISPSLVSGFLQAIYGLYQYAESELASTESGKGLESLNMAGMRWLYVEKKGLIFIAATDAQTEIQLLRDQLGMIAETFITKFGSPFDALYTTGVETWIQSDFNPFIPELDAIISQWEQMKDVEKSAKMMDFLDVVQNIMQRFQYFPGFNQLVEGGQLDILGEAFSEGNWDMSFLSSLDEEEIRRKIEGILFAIMDYFKSNLGDQLSYYISQYFLPYFKSDWARIKEAKIDEILVQVIF
jgi:hypothetical protein